MKYTFMMLALMVSTTIFAQDAAQISDDDLKKYAVVQDSVAAMKKALFDEVSKMVNETKKITVERFNELSKIEKDQEKLTAALATPDELSFLKEVADKKAATGAKINSTIQAMAKDYIGVATYNKIKKGLTSDAALKARYEEVSAAKTTTGS